jgi:hypothetical protein
MAYIFKNKTWHIKGVDSVALHSETQVETWCLHNDEGEYINVMLDSIDYIQCKHCGRNFQMIHPVIAEQIIRSKDEEIQRMMRMIANV